MAARAAAGALEAAHGPSPLDLSGGWLARPRGLDEWPFYQALGAGGRRVVEVLLLAARFKPGEVWFEGQRIPLAVGELFCSEEEIARRCGRGVSRKVVRRALRGLAEGGFLVRRPALREGHCPHVISICDYALLLPAEQDEGPPEGPPEGQARANEGPSEGQRRAPKEQGEPGEPGKPRASGLADAFHERVAQLLGVEAEALATSRPGKEKETLQKVGAEVERLGLPRALDVAEAAIRRWTAAHPDDPISSLAFFVDALEKARPARKANGAAVLPANWWTLVPPEDIEAYRAARERLSPELGRSAPLEVTTVAGVEVPGARELLDGLRAKAVAARRAAL